MIKNVKIAFILLSSFFIQSCALVPYLTDFFGGDSSNSGTQVKTNVDAQIGGNRQNKVGVSENKTNVDELHASNANLNSNGAQSFNNSGYTVVHNGSTAYWFWLAITGWIFFAVIGWFMPSPRRIFKCFREKRADKK